MAVALAAMLDPDYQLLSLELTAAKMSGNKIPVLRMNKLCEADTNHRHTSHLTIFNF